MTDLPAEWISVVVEAGDGIGPRREKGAGEGSLNPVAAAVVTAVARATGRWHEVLPLRGERVWNGMR